MAEITISMDHIKAGLIFNISDRTWMPKDEQEIRQEVEIGSSIEWRFERCNNKMVWEVFTTFHVINEEDFRRLQQGREVHLRQDLF